MVGERSGVARPVVRRQDPIGINGDRAGPERIRQVRAILKPGDSGGAAPPMMKAPLNDGLLPSTKRKPCLVGSIRVRDGERAGTGPRSPCRRAEEKGSGRVIVPGRRRLRRIMIVGLKFGPAFDPFVTVLRNVPPLIVIKPLVPMPWAVAVVVEPLLVWNTPPLIVKAPVKVLAAFAINVPRALRRSAFRRK